MRRVVITGLGAVTPIGNDVETFWNHLIEGKNGIGPLTHFDTENYRVKIAAEVKDFDASLYMDKNFIRKNDLFCHYAMAAAVQAVEDSGIEGTIDSDRFGVYFGSGIGGLNTISGKRAPQGIALFYYYAHRQYGSG